MKALFTFFLVSGFLLAGTPRSAETLENGKIYNFTRNPLLNYYKIRTMEIGTVFINAQGTSKQLEDVFTGKPQEIAIYNDRMQKICKSSGYRPKELTCKLLSGNYYLHIDVIKSGNDGILGEFVVQIEKIAPTTQEAKRQIIFKP
jgi:hypothetical protein